MTTATSRSLSDVPDILCHVFSYLDPIHQPNDDQAYESRQSLSFAARSCKAFTDPALDVLWKRLPDDQPLADLLCELGIATREGIREGFEHLGEKTQRYCLPYRGDGGYYIPGVVDAYEERWRLFRGYDLKYVLQTADDPRGHPNWPRFVEYASRVRAITLFVFNGPAWSTMWEQLLAITDRAPILPRLLSVAFCHFIPKALNPGAFALISPSVRNLNLSVNNEDSWYELDKKFRSTFNRSFGAAPEIEKLRLDFHPSILGGSLLRTHCAQLRHVEILPLLDLDGLRLLTELPALQHLSISLDKEDFPEATGRSLTFKSITTLIVEGTWANLSILLDTACFPSMHALSITGWEYGGPAAEVAKAATQCFRTLVARQPSITSLSVSAKDGRVPPSSGCVVFTIALVDDAFAASLLDIVHPLLALSALRHLALGFPNYFDIACTEVDLRTVAEALPALEAFHLRVWPYFGFSGSRQNDSDADPPQRIRGGPLHALAHFARNCPRLRVLHLPEMEMTKESLALALASLSDSQLPGSDEKHGLRTLVVRRVLLPAGRADFAGRVSEVVRGAFPLAASPFRLDRLAMQEDWAVVDEAATQCPACTRGPELTFAFNLYDRS